MEGLAPPHRPRRARRGGASAGAVPARGAGASPARRPGAPPPRTHDITRRRCTRKRSRLARGRARARGGRWRWSLAIPLTKPKALAEPSARRSRSVRRVTRSPRVPTQRLAAATVLLARDRAHRPATGSSGATVVQSPLAVPRLRAARRRRHRRSALPAATQACARRGRAIVARRAPCPSPRARLARAPHTHTPA